MFLSKSNFFLFKTRNLLRINGLNNVYSKNYVHRWSNLAAAFNTTKSWMENSDHFKFSTKPQLGLFTYPDLKEHTGMYILKEQMMDKAYDLMEEIVSKTRTRKMVAIFDELSDTICRVADLAEFIRHVHCSEDFAQVAQNVNAAASSLVEKLNTNQQLYYALKSVVEEGDVSGEMDELDTLVAKLFLFDFEQCGVHLGDKERDRFVTLSEKIHNVSTGFLQGTQLPHAVSLEQVPAQLHDRFSVKDGRVVVGSLHSSSSDELVRESAYKIYLYPNKDQQQLLEELLTYRHQLAQLTGFPTYVHRAVRGTMIESPDNIHLFLNTLADKVAPKAKVDFDILQKVKRLDVGADVALRPWDTQYYSNRIKQQNLDLDISSLMSYFSLGACMDGVNHLFTTLFGLSLHAEEMMKGEGWEYDLFKLRVEDSDGTVLGYIYCDFFERCVKPMQDSHFTIVGGRQYADGSYQLPVIVLLLNLPEPSKLSPCLLSPSMVENLFHEFGHALHSMVARTKYQHVTGTRCSTDFAEVPSILMEYFASDPRVIKTFARHHRTGETIPDNLLDKLCDCRSLFLASDMQFQLYYSMIDQVYHGPHPLPKSVNEVSSDVMRQYHGLGDVTNTCWHLRFGHLVGYGAKYYSYLLSRAVASRVWQAGFKDDPFNRTSGNKLRLILSHGGGKPPMDLVEDFLGSRPSIDELVSSLEGELEQAQHRQSRLLSPTSTSH